MTEYPAAYKGTDVRDTTTKKTSLRDRKHMEPELASTHYAEHEL